MNLLIIGPPGSGKSTQAELLAEELGIPHLSIGDLCHYLSEEDSKRGREIKKVMESGALVDDKYMLKLIDEQMKGKQYQSGFIIDGAPRNLWQAQNFSHRLSKVFYLKVSDKENIARLIKRGRKDTDSPEIIKKRLAVYHQETEPMLDYYREMGILEEVDGERSVEEIFEDILKRLKE